MNLKEAQEIMNMGRHCFTEQRRESLNPFKTTDSDASKSALWLAGYYLAEAESQTDLTSESALRLIGLAKFREFTQADWMGYSGCESKNPMHGEVDWAGARYVIILDGAVANIIKEGDEYGGQEFTLNVTSAG